MNAETSDGGGCTEAWETLSELQSESEVKTNDGSGVGRRSLLKTTAGLSIGASLFPGLTAAKSTEELNITGVTEISDRKKRILDRAESDPEFRAAHQALVGEGLTRRAADVYISEAQERSFHTVKVQYTDNRRTGSLLWSTLDGYETNALINSPDGYQAVSLPDNEDQVRTADVSATYDLPDLPGCPGTDYNCLATTIALNGAPGFNCGICAGAIANGETTKCAACLESLANVYRPCTICTG